MVFVSLFFPALHLMFVHSDVLTDAHAPRPLPRSPKPAPSVFTSSVGNEALVAVLVLSITPCLIEAKNRLQGTDEDVSSGSE